MTNSKPYWPCRDKLLEHLQKRLTEDRHCWLDLMGKSDISKDEYRTKSYKVIQRAWCEFSGEKRSARSDAGGFEWQEESDYFVDDQLIMVVANKKTKHIKTCYHKHYGDAGHSVVMSWLPGERKSQFERRLAKYVENDVFRKFQRKKPKSSR